MFIVAAVAFTILYLFSLSRSVSKSVYIRSTCDLIKLIRCLYEALQVIPWFEKLLLFLVVEIL